MIWFRLPTALIEEKLYCGNMCRGFAETWHETSQTSSSNQGLQYATTTEAQLAAEGVLRSKKLYPHQGSFGSRLQEALLQTDWPEVIGILYQHPSVLTPKPLDINSAVEEIGKVPVGETWRSVFLQFEPTIV